jgi:hypothetical protein
MQAPGPDAAALSGARFVRQLEPGAQHVTLDRRSSGGRNLLSCVGRSEEPRRNRTAFPGAWPASVLASRLDAQAGASLPPLLGAEGEVLGVGHDDVIQQRETDDQGGVAQRRSDDTIRT